MIEVRLTVNKNLEKKWLISIPSSPEAKNWRETKPSFSATYFHDFWKMTMAAWWDTDGWYRLGLQVFHSLGGNLKPGRHKCVIFMFSILTVWLWQEAPCSLTTTTSPFPSRTGTAVGISLLSHLPVYLACGPEMFVLARPSMAISHLRDTISAWWKAGPSCS